MISVLLALLAGQDIARQTVMAMFEAFNRHDAAAIARLYAPDARLASSDFCKVRSGRDVERTYRALFVALPDIHDQVDTMIVEGDRIAVHFTATSKAAGMALPIQAMLRVENGLIVEDDSVFDTGGKLCEP